MYDNNKSLTENAMNGVDITEPNLPTELDITAEKDFMLSEQTMDALADDINEYLADKFGFMNSGWSFSITIGDILWDFE